MGKKKKEIGSMYKIRGREREFFRIAIQSKIEKGSPLYLSGYNNNKHLFTLSNYIFIFILMCYILIILFKLFKNINRKNVINVS